MEQKSVELLRRKFLTEQQENLFDLVDSDMETLFTKQSGLIENVKDKQKQLAEKLSNLTQEISTLDHFIIKKSESQTTHISGKKNSPRKNSILLIEESTKEPVHLEELVSTLNKYGLLKGDILQDVQQAVDQEIALLDQK